MNNSTKTYTISISEAQRRILELCCKQAVADEDTLCSATHLEVLRDPHGEMVDPVGEAEAMAGMLSHLYSDGLNDFNL